MSEAQLFTSMTFPEIYERVVRPLFRPFAEELVARLKPGPRDSLIDVACGTGIAARIGRDARACAQRPRGDCMLATESRDVFSRYTRNGELVFALSSNMATATA